MRLKTVPLLVSCLVLGACSPTIPAPGQPGFGSDIRYGTTQLCRYVPSQRTIADIVMAFAPVTASALVVAQQICDAVTRYVPLGEPYTPTVAGVVIEGQFIP